MRLLLLMPTSIVDSMSCLQFPGLNTSRAFGDVAAQQLGLSSAPAMQAFELTAQDVFVVRRVLSGMSCLQGSRAHNWIHCH